MTRLALEVLHQISGGRKGQPRPVRISAGTVEAYSTGDADLLNSPLMNRLLDEKEKLGHSKRRQVMVPVIITKP